MSFWKISPSQTMRFFTPYLFWTGKKTFCIFVKMDKYTRININIQDICQIMLKEDETYDNMKLSSKIFKKEWKEDSNESY